MIAIHRYLLTLCFFLLSVAAVAQNVTIKPLHPGAQVPDVPLSGWLDNKTKAVKLSDLYKNKLLILDFWATWCGSCLEETTVMDSLKTIFGDRIDFVVVGYESYATISKFFDKHPNAKPKYLSILTQDKTLLALFPHFGIPHEVWIDRTGKVVAITGGEAVTEKNLSGLLKTGELKIEEKADNLSFDVTRPFHLRDTSFSARSLFTGRTKGIQSYSGGTGSDKVQYLTRIFEINSSIIDLYWTAVFHREISGENYDRIVLEAKDSLRFMSPKRALQSYRKSKYYDRFTTNNAEWDNENLYCYDLQVLTPQRDTALYNHMLSDLNFYLNLNGRWERRSKECYLLVYRVNGNHRLNASGNFQEVVYGVKPPIDSSYYVPIALHHENISTLIRYLNMTINKEQVVNETGISNSEMFDFDLNDLRKGNTADEINMMLEKYGLMLVRGNRKVPLFVISEK